MEGPSSSSGAVGRLLTEDEMAEVKKDVSGGLGREAGRAGAGARSGSPGWGQGPAGGSGSPVRAGVRGGRPAPGREGRQPPPGRAPAAPPGIPRRLPGGGGQVTCGEARRGRRARPWAPRRPAGASCPELAGRGSPRLWPPGGFPVSGC